MHLLEEASVSLNHGFMAPKFQINPVLLAIAEYGMILAMMKWTPNDAVIHGMKIELVYKWIDLCSFAVSLVYLILFNIVYWVMAYASFEHV